MPFCFETIRQGMCFNLNNRERIDLSGWVMNQPPILASLKSFLVSGAKALILEAQWTCQSLTDTSSKAWLTIITISYINVNHMDNFSRVLIRKTGLEKITQYFPAIILDTEISHDGVFTSCINYLYHWDNMKSFLVSLLSI